MQNAPSLSFNNNEIHFYAMSKHNDYLILALSLKFHIFFRAFDVHRRSFLDFNDILLGLACMEPYTQHGGNPAEIRCRYIFRFYNRSKDGKLHFEEFK